MPALLQLEGPGRLGCVGCTHPTTQPSGTVALSGLRGLHGLHGASSIGAFFTTSPFAMAVGLGIGAFYAWHSLFKRAKTGPALSGRRRRR